MFEVVIRYNATSRGGGKENRIEAGENRQAMGWVVVVEERCGLPFGGLKERCVISSGWWSHCLDRIGSFEGCGGVERASEGESNGKRNTESSSSDVT